jgi:hypothetical protein
VKSVAAFPVPAAAPTPRTTNVKWQVEKKIARSGPNRSLLGRPSIESPSLFKTLSEGGGHFSIAEASVAVKTFRGGRLRRPRLFHGQPKAYARPSRPPSPPETSPSSHKVASTKTGFMPEPRCMSAPSPRPLAAPFPAPSSAPVSINHWQRRHHPLEKQTARRSRARRHLRRLRPLAFFFRGITSRTTARPNSRKSEYPDTRLQPPLFPSRPHRHTNNVTCSSKGSHQRKESTFGPVS